MKLRCWVAGLLVMSCTAAVALAVSGSLGQDPASADPARLAYRTSGLSAPPVRADVRGLRPPNWGRNPIPLVAVPMPAAAAMAVVSSPSSERGLTTWSHDIAVGEALDGILADAGLGPSYRAAAAAALGAEYDLRRLRPGHAVTVTTTSDGALRRVMLEVDDGVIIEAIFGERLTTRVLVPEPEIVYQVGEAVVETSLFAAVESAAVPARFAVDLAQMLAGIVDFGRDMRGGEILRLLWREARIDGEIVGQSEITFAALDTGDALYEVIWPDDGSGEAAIYRDGEVLRVYAQPVEGARLSSVFGRRRHPILGDVRMHTGVDFAAARGTPVHATAPGRISFIGSRSGYGRVVEIAHGPGTMTRYAHLSAVPDGIKVGDLVAAGGIIGNVGATGTATGPNLHYEVLVNGMPTDPLADDRLTLAGGMETQDVASRDRLEHARSLLAARLSARAGQDTSERS